MKRTGLSNVTRKEFVAHRQAILAAQKAASKAEARRIIEKLSETRLADRMRAFYTQCPDMARSTDEAMAIIDRYCRPCEHFTGDGCRRVDGCQEKEKWQIAYGVTTKYLPMLFGLVPPCEKWGGRPLSRE